MSEIDSKKLTEFVENTKRLISTKPQMNEMSTKAKIINPLLELLGWNLIVDVDYEYNITVGSSTVRPDYALLIDHRPTVFIEAKSFGSQIGEKEKYQAISYGRVEEVKWVAVTNGKTIHIFDTTCGKSPDECSLTKIDLNEFINRQDELSLLSKKSIQSKETDLIAETIREKRNFIANLYNKRNELASEIADVFKKLADKSLHQKIEELSEEILNHIINGLHTQKKGEPKREEIIEFSDHEQKARKVHLQELVDAGLLKDGQILYFSYNTRIFNDEQAQIIASSNKLQYKLDGRTYSISKLAENLLIKHGFKHDKHGVAGPKYWMTKERKLLDQLNEQIRQQSRR